MIVHKIDDMQSTARNGIWCATGVCGARSDNPTGVSVAFQRMLPTAPDDTPCSRCWPSMNQPCPFCGAPMPNVAPLSRDGEDHRQVRCEVCGARGPSAVLVHNDEVGRRTDALEKWNCRARARSSEPMRAVVVHAIAPGTAGPNPKTVCGHDVHSISSRNTVFCGFADGPDLRPGDTACATCWPGAHFAAVTKAWNTREERLGLIESKVQTIEKTEAGGRLADLEDKDLPEAIKRIDTLERALASFRGEAALRLDDHGARCKMLEERFIGHVKFVDGQISALHARAETGGADARLDTLGAALRDADVELRSLMGATGESILVFELDKLKRTIAQHARQLDAAGRQINELHAVRTADVHRDRDAAPFTFLHHLPSEKATTARCGWPLDHAAERGWTLRSVLNDKSVSADDELCPRCWVRLDNVWKVKP